MALKVSLLLVLVLIEGGMAYIYEEKFNYSMGNGDDDKCVAHSCTYDFNTNACFNATDPSVNMTEICMASNDDPDYCIMLGCSACKCTKKCLPKSMAGECDPGCTAYCQDIDGCKLANCVYDIMTNKCYDNKDNKRDLKGICMVSGEDKALCERQGCWACPNRNKCVPLLRNLTCNPRCWNYDAESCKDIDECMYDKHAKKCIDGPTPDRTDACHHWDGRIKGCQDQGCRVCPCTKECKDPLKAVKECDIGCSKWCEQETECVAFGCRYDYATGRCYEGLGTFLFCGNVCGVGCTDHDGANYVAIERNKIRVLSRREHSECICSWDIPVSDDDPIIQCGFASPEMEIDVPIREDSSFDIGLHITELEKDETRNFIVLLNDHVILDSLKKDIHLEFGVPQTLEYKFKVGNNQTTLIMDNPPVTYPIVDRALKLRLVSFNPQIGSARALLNAFCIKYAWYDKIRKSARLPLEAEEN